MASVSPSPLSTGGAGTIFEYRAAGLALTAVQVGDRVEGLAVPVTEVGFQQRFAGHRLDDVVVFGRGGDGRELTVEYQVKRALRPVPSDPGWRAVIGQCLTAVGGDT